MAHAKRTKLFKFWVRLFPQTATVTGAVIALLGMQLATCTQRDTEIFKQQFEWMKSVRAESMVVSELMQGCIPELRRTIEIAGRIRSGEFGLELSSGDIDRVKKLCYKWNSRARFFSIESGAGRNNVEPCISVIRTSIEELYNEMYGKISEINMLDAIESASELDNTCKIVADHLDLAIEIKIEKMVKKMDYGVFVNSSF